MADFAYKPDFGYQTAPEYDVLRVKFENNMDQRRLRTSTKIRKYKLVFDNRDGTEKDAVKAFFDAKFGSLTAFSITIDGEDVTGIFVEETFSFVRKAPDVYSYQFEFEEIVSA